MESMRIVVFVVLALLCQLSFASPNLTKVTVHQAILNPISDSITYPARAVSEVNALIYSDIDGVVTKVFKTIGQYARKGETLLTIQHIDPVFQYAPVKVVSSVSGVVSQMKVNPGTRVAKSETIASVTDPNKLRLTIEVTAGELSQVKKGLKGLFSSPDLATPLNVVVRGVSPYVDPATGTATCDLVLEKNSSILRPGMIGRISFELNKREGFLVPEGSLVDRDGKLFVRIVKDDLVDVVPVVVGTKEKGFAEITKGLNSGDQVVSQSANFLAKGEKVIVENPPKKEEPKGTVQ